MDLAQPRASPDGRVHSELPKEITMIRTIAVALALCLASFGAFAQGSSTTDSTAPKAETKSDTTGTKASKKHKKAKKAKKSDSSAKDSSSTAAPK